MSYNYSNVYLIIFTIIFIFSGLGNAKSKEETSNPPGNNKCGTFLTEKQKHILIDQLCVKVDSNGRCITQKTYLSSSGKFLIHYDTIGKNAVPLQDNDNNGIPDYVDSAAYYFDYAYKVEVDSMGYAAPAPDNGWGGSDAYDVYLLNVGDYKYNSSPYYGITQSDFQINKTRKFPCYTSHITIDNDFSPLDSILNLDSTRQQTYTEFGIACLKITAAHEFHHAIQYNYGVPTPSTPSLNEMTSTGMEYRLFPETKDYQTHLRSLFKYPASYPFGSGDADIGYKYACFTQYINHYYGDKLLRRMWELVKDGYAGYMSLDSAFKEAGSSLRNEWHGFIPWVYFTGTRAKPGLYFKDAAEFPNFAFNIDGNFSPPSTIISEYLQSFEIRAFRQILPTNKIATSDTADIFVVNTDLYSAIKQYSSDTPFDFTIADSYLLNSLQIGSTPYYFLMQANEATIGDTLFFNTGFPVSQKVYPNPVKIPMNDKIYFPVPAYAGIKDNISLTIFTSEMVTLFSGTLPVDIDNQKRVAIFNWKELIPDLSSGVYIYYVNFKDEQITGKFAVIK